MHNHVYKAGGEWKTKDGIDYTIKAVMYDKVSEYIANGWSKTLEEALAGVTRPEPADVTVPDVPKPVTPAEIEALGIPLS